MSKPVGYIADHLRRVLINGASAPHTAEVQKFFKEEIQSRGWRTGELRKLARRFSRTIRGQEGLDYLVAVADELFRGNVLEEKVLAVLLLEPCAGECTSAHFKLFESWLDRVATWADHDSLVQYIIGPMIVADPRRLRRVFVWARGIAGEDAPLPLRCCAERIAASSGMRCGRLLMPCWKTKTTWCAKGWDGSCAKPRGTTARAQYRC